VLRSGTVATGHASIERAITAIADGLPAKKLTLPHQQGFQESKGLAVSGLFGMWLRHNTVSENAR
jgi:hypothetical protein